MHCMMFEIQGIVQKGKFHGTMPFMLKDNDIAIFGKFNKKPYSFKKMKFEKMVIEDSQLFFLPLYHTSTGQLPSVSLEWLVSLLLQLKLCR